MSAPSPSSTGRGLSAGPTPSRSRRTALLVGLLLSIAIVGLWVLRAKVFEIKMVPIDKGYSGEAAGNPYFALQILYNKLGVDTSTHQGLRRLPPVDGALLLAVDHRALSPRETERLISWVHQGGTLLVGALIPSSQVFLEEAGLELFDEPESATQVDKESRSRFSPDPLAWPRLRPIGDHRPALEAHRDGAVGSARIQSVPVGRGSITVLTDLEFLTNPQLASKNRPDKAWWLIQQPGTPSTVWIVFRNPPPSIWALLISRGRPIALALLVLCLVAVAVFARPMGPRLEPPPRDRRHLIEHLRATGSFLWQEEVEHVLLKAEQDVVYRHLARGGRPSNDELLNLAEQAVARLPDPPSRARLRAALALPSTQDPQRFTETVKILETLRRSS